MTCTIEIRADTTVTPRALTTSKMQSLSLICGHTRLDAIRNGEISEICEVQDVYKWGGDEVKKGTNMLIDVN